MEEYSISMLQFHSPCICPSATYSRAVSSRVCHAMPCHEQATRAADVSTAASLGLKSRQDRIARQPRFHFPNTDHHSLRPSRSCERLHRQRHHHHHYTSFRPPPTFAIRSRVSPSPDARPSSTLETQLTACFKECMKAPCKSSDSLFIKHP